jgi:hypothetical protein
MGKLEEIVSIKLKEAIEDTAKTRKRENDLIKHLKPLKPDELVKWLALRKCYSMYLVSLMK